ncbi:MAG: hypothetical protein ACPLXM_00125 [Bacteroidales bacterium]
MEDLENKNTQENFMLIDQEIKDYLLESARWGKFIAIVGYIGIGFLIIIGLIFMAGFSFASRFSGARFPMVIAGFVYILLAIVYFFPVNYLYAFSDQMKKGFESNNRQTLASGFSNMKSMFKFIGILTIVILSIYALILLFAIPVSLLIRHNLSY